MFQSVPILLAISMTPIVDERPKAPVLEKPLSAYVRASKTDRGEVVLRILLPSGKSEYRREVSMKGGRPVSRYALEPTLKEITLIAGTGSTRIVDLKQKNVPLTGLRERFDQWTPILLSYGQFPDSFYLQTMKEDTIVFVLPSESGEPPSLLTPRPPDALPD